MPNFQTFGGVSCQSCTQACQEGSRSLLSRPAQSGCAPLSSSPSPSSRASPLCPNLSSKVGSWEHFAISPRLCIITDVLGQAVGPYWLPSPPFLEERPPMTALPLRPTPLKPSLWVRGFQRIMERESLPPLLSHALPLGRSVGE